eukprot:TRINITY_DN40103_c0_g1_i1.p1 TRINITY_DN40103_c0_g1~~TRINITY_DN40103_c0_g1_i1.p1  ORF type:complete len:116 (-),score=32.49 TRINITY_DN40103_c0_g1_i1:21-368(-)
MIRRPPRSTLSSSSAASDVYKRQIKKKVIQKQQQCAYCLILFLEESYISCIKKLMKKLMKKENQIKLKQRLKCQRYENVLNFRNKKIYLNQIQICLLYTSPSPRDRQKTRMPSSA